MKQPMKNGAFNLGLVINYKKLIELQASNSINYIDRPKTLVKSREMGVKKHDKRK